MANIKSYKHIIAVLLVLCFAGGTAYFWLVKHPERVELAEKMAAETIDEAKAKLEEVARLAEEELKKQEEEKLASEIKAREENEKALAEAKRLEEEQKEKERIQAEELEAERIAQEEALKNQETVRGLVDNTNQKAVPSRNDDAVVKVAFIDDLADFLVNNYNPKTNKLIRGLRSTNIRYGTGMQGLAWVGDDMPTGRADALRYFYTPSMLTALYRLYIDRFMLAMQDASLIAQDDTAKPLTEEQVRKMYEVYSGNFRVLANTLTGISKVENFKEKMDEIAKATRNMVVVNTRYINEIFNFDQARENGSSNVEELKTKMLAASDAYQQAAKAVDNLKLSLLAEIKSNIRGSGLSDDTMYYAVQWVARRVAQSDSALEATAQAGSIFSQLANRFENAAAQ